MLNYTLFSGTWLQCNYVLEKIQVTAAQCTILFFFPSSTTRHAALSKKKRTHKLFACFFTHLGGRCVLSPEVWWKKKSNMISCIAQSEKGHKTYISSMTYSPKHGVDRIKYSRRGTQWSPLGKGKKNYRYDYSSKYLLSLHWSWAFARILVRYFPVAEMSLYFFYIR